MERAAAMAAGTTTSWPQAAVAIAGIALVASVAIVVIWQALATWRTRAAATRDEAYRMLAEQTARELREIHGLVRDVALMVGDADRKQAER